MSIQNGQLKQLESDVETIKDTLTVLSENIGKIAAPLEHVSNALTVVSQRLDFLCNTMGQMIQLWEKSVPVKLVVLLILLVAAAFGGKELLAIFSKALL